MSGHQFSFSQFRDGFYSPSLVENLSTTLDVASYTVTLTSTTGISAGMLVTVSAGDGVYFRHKSCKSLIVLLKLL
ncbi:MAG: hypothetical protein CM15mV3_0390 [Caudoviricetes sp.]|nr:MAG: hypothetical protein CM15mV3_0390 [Caudoviricetes sp.]